MPKPSCAHKPHHLQIEQGNEFDCVTLWALMPSSYPFGISYPFVLKGSLHNQQRQRSRSQHPTQLAREACESRGYDRWRADSRSWRFGRSGHGDSHWQVRPLHGPRRCRSPRLPSSHDRYWYKQ